MSYTIDEVVLGALLHDIGKFMQRAGGGNQTLGHLSVNMENVLCPTNGKGGYTHKHVLWTNAFFDWMEREGIWFPQGVNLAKVRTFAASHHLPDSPRGEAAMGWMSALADRYSSGMDRKPFQEESDTGEKGWNAFRKIPQKCIFDHVILDTEKLGDSGANAVKLGPLDPSDPHAVLPEPWPKGGQDEELPSFYALLWEGFCKGIRTVAAAGLTPHLFEEALLGLLERYTWAVPSSTIDIPDISLYDHARTSSAIAACLFRHHEDRGDLDNLEAIKDSKRSKFRLLAGDLSGIQSTLFTLRRQGVRGVNKILRARSFLLGSIAEAAGLRAGRALGLPHCCVLQQAAGRFLILVPEVRGVLDVVQQLRSEIDRWMVEHYTGSLSLNLALTESFGGESFQSAAFKEVIASLGLVLDEAKQRPLSTCAQGVLKVDYPFGQACSACGIRPARNDGEDDGRCQTCQAEFTIGGKLPHSSYICWVSSEERFQETTEILGQQLLLLPQAPSLSQMPSLVSVRRIGGQENGEPWAQRYIANHVPMFSAQEELYVTRYKGIEISKEMGAGTPKTFEHLGAEALEYDKDSDSYRGKPFLALLKADVDRLGFVFSHGLEGKPKGGYAPQTSMFSLSRVVQLSRMLDLYFTGYLPGLLRREFPNTYVVYAGGDDLLLIGPWFQTLFLVKRIQETFALYTGKNPNLTISAGLCLMRSNDPVNRAVQEAEAFLDEAKHSGRNRVSAVCGGSVLWSQYSEMLENAEWVHQRMNDKDYPVSTGFIYSLLRLAEDAEAASRGMIARAGWRAKLAYHLARNVKGEDKDDARRRRAAWLKRLGFDEAFNPMEVSAGIINWRVGLMVALYRNRS